MSNLSSLRATECQNVSSQPLLSSRFSHWPSRVIAHHPPASPTSGLGLGTTNDTVPDTAAAADGSTLKSSAPVPISPLNDQQVSDLPTLTSTATTLKFAQRTLQYRFELFNDAGAKVQDSGLLG